MKAQDVNGSDNSTVGRENCYTCQTCRKVFTTVDRDAGVTPFMVRHQHFDPKSDCKGDCYSSFYPKGPRPKHVPEPSHEWFTPSASELLTMSAAMQDHVRQGGLDLRPLTAREKGLTK